MPANTPISIQPLDAEGKALQLMRSWMTAMPGEVVQCAGCHEPQNTRRRRDQATIAGRTAAVGDPAVARAGARVQLRPRGPAGDRQVLRRLPRRPAAARRPADRRSARRRCRSPTGSSITSGNGGGYAGKFSVGYAELHRYVRRPGIESDYHMLEPMEFHADTTELVQMLRRATTA